MKKLLCIALLLLILGGAFSFVAFADWDDMPFVYVTISDGTHQLVYQRFRLIDHEKDGKATVCDAIMTAHYYYHEEGADQFQWTETAYGKSITMLWAKENGMGFGYYINDEMGTDLDAEVKEGDHIYAFVYTDTQNFSDTYCYFDTVTVESKVGESVTATLYAKTFDEAFNPVTRPVADAYITFNGKRTEFKTDSEGRVTFTFSQDGEIVVSAVSDSEILVPPTMVAWVDGNLVLQGFVILGIALLVAALSFLAWYGIRKKNRKDA